MLQLRKGTPSPVVSPEEAAAYDYSPAERALVEATTADHAVGGPETVHAKLAALVERTGADELMLSTRAHSLEPAPVRSPWWPSAGSDRSPGLTGPTSGGLRRVVRGRTSSPSRARWSRSPRSRICR